MIALSTPRSTIRDARRRSRGDRVRRRLARSGALAAAVLALFGAMAVPPAPAFAGGGEIATETRLKANSDPAVHLVAVEWAATVVVPVPTVDEMVLQALYDQILGEVQSGQLPQDEAAIMERLVMLIAANATAIFVPTDQIESLPVSMSGIGTGFAITPDGYMVTAAHVVKADEDELLRNFLTIAMQEWLTNAANALIQSSGMSFTEDQVVTIQEGLAGYALSYASISDLTQSNQVDMGIAVAGAGQSHNLVPAEIVEVGESYPGKDVALLKVDGYSAMPTIPLATVSDPVSEGEPVYCLGYPAASTFMPSMSLSSELQVNFTTGLISSKRTNESGTPIYQSQVDISGGNSGGPCIDRSGEVVALAAAGVIDENGTVAGQAFLIPVSVIAEKLQQKNVTPAQSQTTATYAAGLELFFMKHYSAALDEFNAVRALYPGHPYVDQYISRATAEIAAGNDQTPSFPWVWVAAGGGVLVAAIAVLVVLLMRRRRRARRAAAQPVEQSAETPAALVTPASPNEADPASSTATEGPRWDADLQQWVGPPPTAR